MKTVLMVSMMTIAFSAAAGEIQTNMPVQATTSSVPVAVQPVPVTNAVVVEPTPATNAVVPAPDPMVGKVLLSLARHLQSARNFRCDVSFLIQSEMEGMKQEISATYALAAEKPNRLALRYLKGMAGNTVVCDGTNLVTYAAMLNKYDEKKAPQSWEQFSAGVGPMAGNMLFVDNLLRDDIYAAIMDGVVKVSYVGKETIAGMECDRLRFVQDQFDWDLWVTTGLKPVVIQVLSDMSKGLGLMNSEAPPPKGMRMTVLNQFSNWRVDGDLPADTFLFKPPAGARKTDSLFDGEEEDLAGQPGPVVPESLSSETNKADQQN
jgi:hypothetical protein